MALTQVLFALVIVAGVLGGMALQNAGRARRANRKELLALERTLSARLTRLEQLEERIAVLEKIVTDRRYDLDREFRNLENTG